VASTLGGNAWDAAGPIWYATLRDNRLNPTATFQEFARLTVANAQQTYGGQSKEAEAVTGAWDTVQVPL
jgi:Zn-dependent metalloprotease